MAGPSRLRRHPPPPLIPTLFLLLIISAPPQAAHAVRLLHLRQLATLISLSHSLLSRVASSRASRGDYAPASRARRLAAHLDLFSTTGAWSLSWDYLRNYAFSGGGGTYLSASTRAASRLLATAAEASRLGTRAELAQWLIRNYAQLREAAEELLEGVLDTFFREGPLREAVMDLKREVEEGELLKDCLEIGAKDLEGLLSIAKDLLSGYSAPTSSSRHAEL